MVGECTGRDACATTFLRRHDGKCELVAFSICKESTDYGYLNELDFSREW